MPLYLFQILQPPGIILKQIGRICTRFLWGTTNNRTNLHWRSWKRICKPKHEGGLGFRFPEDMIKAFSLKLWWRLRTHSNLWTDYMKSKYYRSSHPSMAVARRTDSSCWKRLCHAKLLGDPRIKWKIGRGMVSFWYDQWLDCGRLVDVPSIGPPNSDCVRNFLVNDQWNVQLLARSLPDYIVKQITKISIGRTDCAFWCDANCQSFSTSSAWNLTRIADPEIPHLSALWNKSTPVKVSMMNWRLLLDLLPTDTKMRTFGFHGPSQCQCCEQEETIHHIFLESETARKVWLHFYNIFELPFVEHSSMQSALWYWRNSRSWITPCHVRIVIPLLINWALWEARNNSKHSNIKVNPNNIILRVDMKIRSLIKAMCIKGNQCIGENHFCHVYEIQIRNKISSKPFSFYWVKPDRGWVKLNVDGCSKGNPGLAAAGGIIRNFQGRTILSFSLSLGIQNSYNAELYGLLEGLKIVSKLNFPKVWIEADSLCLVNQINNEFIGNWKTFPIFSEIGCMLNQLQWKCSHIWREANAAADFLANTGLNTTSLKIDLSLHSFGLLRGITRLDRMGLPYVRGM